MLAVVAVAAAGVVGYGVWRWRAAPAEPSYDPVVTPSPLAAWTAPWEASPEGGATALPTRWIVLGWDGADWRYALPLLEAGKLPHLEAMMREGAYGDMYSFQPTWSPVLWTSVATGVDPARHGILAWGRVARGGKKERLLFTNADRRVRALWNLLSDAGRRSLLVGYHNTYPAERIEGLVVSNYLYHEHLEDMMQARAGGDGPAGLVYPPQRLEQILEIQREVTASLPGAVSRFAHYAPDEAAAFEAPLRRALGPDDDRRQFFLKKAYLFDEINGRVALSEYEAVKPDLTMVHFQSVDFASHYFLYFHDAQAFASMPWTPAERAGLAAQEPHYRDTVEAFYRFADAWLGRLRALAGPETGVLLLSDHGFEPEPESGRTGFHDSAPPGIFVVAGPGVRRGVRSAGATLYDVFPTLAVTLGLPLAEDLRGAPRADWFEATAWRRLKIARLPSYDPNGRYVPDLPSPEDSEIELLEQLRAIGYVE